MSPYVHCSTEALHELLDPESLPTWLAIPWAELCKEQNPILRLNLLIFTAELTVRLTAALALAEAEQAHGGRLPSPAAASLADSLRLPGFGTWLGMLGDLKHLLPVSGGVIPSLAGWIDQLTKRVKEHRGPAAEESNSIYGDRNDIAHIGFLLPPEASERLDQHLPTLIDILRGARDVLESVLLVADGRRLRGCHPQPADDPRAATLPPGVHVLGANGGLALDPVLWQADAAVRVAEEPEGSSPSRATVQVYARSSQRNRLDYTALGGYRFMVQRSDKAAYERLFPKSARMRKGDGYAPDAFLIEARHLAGQFVGRNEELTAAKAWLKERERDPHCARVGWIGGAAGMGKSMLMAKLVADWSGGQKSLYYHRFRVGDHRNDRRSFLLMLRAALWAWEPLRPLTEEPRTEEDAGTNLEDDVRARLEQLASITEHGVAQPPLFWIFVDGLDEITQVDKRFPQFLHRLAGAGGVWLVAGRPDGELSRIFNSNGAEAVFASARAEGLPPMTAADVRVMLLRGLNFGSHKLLERDEYGGDGATIGNAFVDAVVERADGLPIYVHHVIEDLLAGTLDVRTDENRLPKSFEAYCDAVLDRLGVSVTSIDLARILAMLACAGEPLDHDALAALLAVHDHRPPEVDPELEERVDAALQAGASLLRRVPSPEATEAWALYHHRFRQRFRENAKTVPMVLTAQRVLLRAVGEWRSMNQKELAPLRAHLFRWGTRYALDWGGRAGVDGAAGRLMDMDFLVTRLTVGGSAEVATILRDITLVAAESTARSDLLDDLTVVLERDGRLIANAPAGWSHIKVFLQVAVEFGRSSALHAFATEYLKRHPEITLLTSDLLAEYGRGDARRAYPKALPLRLRPLKSTRRLNGWCEVFCAPEGGGRLWDIGGGKVLVADERGLALVNHGCVDHATFDVEVERIEGYRGAEVVWADSVGPDRFVVIGRSNVRWFAVGTTTRVLAELALERKVYQAFTTDGVVCIQLGTVSGSMPGPVALRLVPYGADFRIERRAFTDDHPAQRRVVAILAAGGGEFLLSTARGYLVWRPFAAVPMGYTGLGRPDWAVWAGGGRWVLSLRSGLVLARACGQAIAIGERGELLTHFTTEQETCLLLSAPRAYDDSTPGVLSIMVYRDDRTKTRPVDLDKMIDTGWSSCGIVLADPTRLAVWDLKGWVTLIDISSGTYKSAPCHTDSVNTAKLIASGSLLVTYGDDRLTKFWSVDRLLGAWEDQRQASPRRVGTWALGLHDGEVIIEGGDFPWCCMDVHAYHGMDLASGGIAPRDEVEQKLLDPLLAPQRLFVDFVELAYVDDAGVEQRVVWAHEGQHTVEHADSASGCVLLAVGRDENDGQSYVPLPTWMRRGAHRVVNVKWIVDSPK